MRGGRAVSETLVLVKGGGDLATGAAHRLRRSGFPVMMTEIERPTMVRRAVSFAECLYAGEWRVEGVASARAEGGSLEEKIAGARALMEAGAVPVMVDPRAEAVARVRPAVVIDAILAKRNLGTRIEDAEVVIGLGPGFTAGVDCHAVIETARGHDLGRVILEGAAKPDTGAPGAIAGYAAERLLRAPRAGAFASAARIGDAVRAGQAVARVDGEEVTARINGVLRGLLRDGIEVSAGFKVGDVDPRADPSHCVTISDKSRAVGGGALEAVMMFLFGVSPAAERAN